MSDTHMEQVKRERRTEDKVPSLDADDIVSWIYDQEDEIESLRARVEEWRTLAVRHAIQDAEHGEKHG